MNYKEARNYIYKNIDVRKINALGIKFHIDHLNPETVHFTVGKPFLVLNLKKEVISDEKIILLANLKKDPELAWGKGNVAYSPMWGGQWEVDHPRYCKWHPSGMTLEEAIQKDLFFSHNWEKAWRTREGEVIPYPEMGDWHLANILKGGFPLTKGVVAELRKRFCHLTVDRNLAETYACESGIFRFLKMTDNLNRNALSVGELSEYLFSGFYGEFISRIIGARIKQHLKT